MATDCSLADFRFDGSTSAETLIHLERDDFHGHGLTISGEGYRLELDVLHCSFSGTGLSVGFTADATPVIHWLDLRYNRFEGDGIGTGISLTGPCGYDEWQDYRGIIGWNQVHNYDTGIGLSCCDVNGSGPESSHVEVDVVRNTIVGNNDGIVCAAVADGLSGSMAGAYCQPRVWNNVIAHNSGCAFREGKETHDEEGDTWTDPKEFITNDLYDNGCMYLDEGTDELNSIGEVNALEGAYDNLSVPPRFVDAAGGDYHLAADSPLIDRGSVGGPFAGWIDFDGDPRVMDGDHDGFAWPDVGADEVP